MVGTWEDEAGQRTYRWALGGQVITWADVDPDTANATFYGDPSDKRVKTIGFGAAGWILSGVVNDLDRIIADTKGTGGQHARP